jgi:hypothetical protein
MNPADQAPLASMELLVETPMGPRLTPASQRLLLWSISVRPAGLR